MKYYDLCNQLYERDKQKGKPLLTQVIQHLGGWKVLRNWENETWDLNKMMQKVQSDFGVSAFYLYKDLSWEYKYASKEMFEKSHWWDQVSADRNCYNKVETYMADALNHLYIKKVLSKKNKDTAHEISDHIRSVMKTQISKSSWMDKETRKYALNKLDKVILKIGYPDWMADQAKVDDQYASFKLNRSSYFDTLLRLVKLKRNLDQQDLKRGGKKHEEWDHLVYSTDVSFREDWNELAIRAGVLQIPFYDGDEPHASSFGSLGFIVSDYLQIAVNERGSFRDTNGQRIVKSNGQPGRWWSNSTISKYNDIKKCLNDVVYLNLTQTVYHPWTGKEVTFNVTRMDDFIRQTKASKIALLGYQDWAKKKGLNEDKIPGLNLSKVQMLFLAQAQTYCEVANWRNYWTARFGYMLSETKTNLAIMQQDDFSQAFKCKRKSMMTRAKKCRLF
ncbi:endothelin-converting enzyme 1 [Elysia marginata]|uniref:Endothelin-converting enzyme 1 n=1 Tax=Elysia marginata TaxID=1093978 RepID=A0AAV4EEY8_9GAST|nr:endothelin-converting enzyme 1 [Elysia marginata]